MARRARGALSAALALALSAGACADPVAPLDARVELVRAPSVFAQLQALAAQAQVRIIVTDAARRLEHAPARTAATGTTTLRDALDAILAQSGFAWRTSPEGSILIEPAAARDAVDVPLDPLHVRDTPLESGAPGAAEVERFDRGIGAGGATRLERDTLPARVALRFDDILRRAVNVSGHGSAFSIRGIERGSDAAATSTIRLDGIPLGGRTLDAGALSIDDLDRIAYERGPRSVWDGFGSLAGAVEHATRDPSPDPERAVAASADGDGGAHAHASLGGETPLAGLTARAALDARVEAGFNRNVARGEEQIDRKRQWSLLARAVYEPDALPGIAARATVLHIDADPGQPAVRPPLQGAAGFDPFARASFDANAYDASLGADGVALSVEWRPTDAQTLEWRGVLAQTHQDVTTGLGTNLADFVVQSDREHLGQTQLRYAVTFSPAWRALAGLEFQRKNVVTSATSIIDLRSFFPPGAPLTITPETRQLSGSALEAETKSSSAILAAEYTHGAWTATLGARALTESRSDSRSTRTRLDAEPCTLAIGTTTTDCAEEFPAFASGSRLGASNHVLVPDFALVFAPRATQRFGLSARSGFLGGGARINLATGLPLGYGPEHSENAEAWWDARWLDGRLSSHVALFYDRWRDRQVPLALPQFGNSVIVNAGRAHAYGGELELRFKPSQRWDFWAAAGRLETRYDDFPFAATTGTNQLAGNQFPGAPELTLDGGFRFDSARGWYGSANAWFSGAAFSDPTNARSGRRPAYAVVDVRGGRKFGRWDVYVYSNNLLDREYIERERVAGIDPTPREYELGRPRQVGIGAEYRW
jgi:hypothetical protein